MSERSPSFSRISTVRKCSREPSMRTWATAARDLTLPRHEQQCPPIQIARIFDPERPLECVSVARQSGA